MFNDAWMFQVYGVVLLLMSLGGAVYCFRHTAGRQKMTGEQGPAADGQHVQVRASNLIYSGQSPAKMGQKSI
ncbi:hypothetical protein [Paenibacillus jiagnxiensis]|uniref:hypothetical protein n=1 Tax=Paenibacillus jiagnxiensis TaxID=3228926 RepID=UPI00339DFD06